MPSSLNNIKVDPYNGILLDLLILLLLCPSITNCLALWSLYLSTAKYDEYGRRIFPLIRLSRNPSQIAEVAVVDTPNPRDAIVVLCSYW